MTVKNVEKLEKSRVAVTVEVGAEEFEAAVAKAYAKARGKLSIPGFRPGKAPRKMIEKLYGAGVFYSDAVDIALPEAYTQAIGQSGLDVVGYPEIEIVDDKIDENGFTFKATVAVYPEVKLGEYKGLTAEKEEIKVSADDVKERLNEMAERNARLVSVDRKAKKGDIAVIDFEGFDNGEAFEGGKGENYELELGSGSFVPGFEDQVIGMKAGEEKDHRHHLPRGLSHRTSPARRSSSTSRPRRSSARSFPSLMTTLPRTCPSTTRSRSSRTASSARSPSSASSPPSMPSRTS